MTVARLLTCLIPVKSWRKSARRALINRIQRRWLTGLLPAWRAHYDALAQVYGERVRRGGKLNVLFIVLDVSMFSGEPVFARMIDSAEFEPTILIVPDVMRESAFATRRAEKARRILAARYGERVVVYADDPAHGEALIAGAQLAFTSNPYPDQTVPSCGARELGRHALVVYLSYSYSGYLMVNVRRLVGRPELSLMWRIMHSNAEAVRHWASGNPHLAPILMVTGYAKMDRFETLPPPEPHARKKIILSPHHSIDAVSDGLTLSNFLRYADFFLSLPDRYPQIDFVFRPHPLLRERLERAGWWGPEKTAAWFDAMAAKANVEYQDGGDYFRTFAEADALIHDCGSFLPEYYYTRKPQCYMLKDEAQRQREFSAFGRRLLDGTYQAYTEADIVTFIERTVLGGDDPLAPARQVLAETEVCINYPDVTGRIIDTIRERIFTEGASV